MEIFILFFVVALCGKMCFFMRKNSRIFNIYIFFVVLYLVLISGMRDVSIGTDTYSYYNYFERNSFLDFNEIAEYYSYKSLGFWYFLKLIYFLELNYQFVIFISSLISIYFINKYVYEFSEDKILTYVIFMACGFFSIGLNVIRQYIAIAITTYSIKFIAENNLKKYLIYLFIASGIHISAIFFLPSYWVARRKINIKNTVCYFIIVIIFGIWGDDIINYFVSFLFGGFAGYLPENINPEERHGKVTLLVYVLVLIFSLIQKDRLLKKDVRNIIFINLTWMAVLIQSLTFIMPLVSRIGWFYSMCMITFIPELIYSVKNSCLKIFLIQTAILFSLVVYFFKVYNLYNIYPYKFFFL